MNTLQKVAEATLRLSEQNVFKECELTGEDAGNMIFMMEEWDEEYNNVREILTGQSPFSEYKQQEIIKAFMKYHKISKEEIEKHLEYKKGFE